MPDDRNVAVSLLVSLATFALVVKAESKTALLFQSKYFGKGSVRRSVEPRVNMRQPFKVVFFIICTLFLGDAEIIFTRFSRTEFI